MRCLVVLLLLVAVVASAFDWLFYNGFGFVLEGSR